jgi:hypothetical protein
MSLLNFIKTGTFWGQDEHGQGTKGCIYQDPVHPSRTPTPGSLSLPCYESGNKQKKGYVTVPLETYLN